MNSEALDTPSPEKAKRNNMSIDISFLSDNLSTNLSVFAEDIISTRQFEFQRMRELIDRVKSEDQDNCAEIEQMTE